MPTLILEDEILKVFRDTSLKFLIKISEIFPIFFSQVGSSIGFIAPINLRKILNKGEKSATHFHNAIVALIRS